MCVHVCLGTFIFQDNTDGLVYMDWAIRNTGTADLL